MSQVIEKTGHASELETTASIYSKNNISSLFLSLMSFISDHLYLCPGKGNWESIDLVGPIPSLDDSGLPKAAGNQL